MPRSAGCRCCSPSRGGFSSWPPGTRSWACPSGIRRRRGPSRRAAASKTSEAVNKPTDLSKLAAPALTEAELRMRLGSYVAPSGLYALNKARPFVGQVACNVGRLVAGSWEEIVLDYEVGASGVADGSSFKVTFKF